MEILNYETTPFKLILALVLFFFILKFVVYWVKKVRDYKVLKDKRRLYVENLFIHCEHHRIK